MLAHHVQSFIPDASLYTLNKTFTGCLITSPSALPPFSSPSSATLQNAFHSFEFELYLFYWVLARSLCLIIIIYLLFRCWMLFFLPSIVCHHPSSLQKLSYMLADRSRRTPFLNVCDRSFREWSLVGARIRFIPFTRNCLLRLSLYSSPTQSEAVYPHLDRTHTHINHVPYVSKRWGTIRAAYWNRFPL